MHSFQCVTFEIHYLLLFSVALIKSSLTSSGAADAVEIEIRSYCVENGFTHVVYSRLTTSCVLCLSFLFLLVLNLHEKHPIAFPGPSPSNFPNKYFYTLRLGSISYCYRV